MEHSGPRVEKDIFSLARSRKEFFYLLAENAFFFFNKGVIIRGVVFLCGHLCTKFSVALI